jgi:hypothetical protein
MAFENRLALNMMLAEKGGACIMIGVLCRTSIPNNIAPDGTITKALQGLTTLSNKLAENLGINDPVTNLMEKWFGRWKGWMISILTSWVVVVRGLILVVCYIIPCVQGLIQWLTETALTKQ